jgi:hypothetical protein
LDRIGQYIAGAFDLDADFEAKHPRAEGGKFAAGDSATISGKSADGKFEGTATVTIVNPHSNADRVTQTKGKRMYEGAVTHIPTATVTLDRSKRGLPPLEFEAHHHTLTKLASAEVKSQARERDKHGFVQMAGAGRATELYPDVHAVLTAAQHEQGANFRGGKTVPNGRAEQQSGFEIEYKRTQGTNDHHTFVRHVGKGRDAALGRYADALKAAGMNPRIGPYRDPEDFPNSPNVVWLDPH